MRWHAPINRPLILPLVLTLVLLLCGTMATAGGIVEAADLDTSVTLGKAKNVSRLRNMWFSAQPSATDLEVAKKEGITTVINLRSPEEMTWDEQATARNLGMTYYLLPVPKDKPFSRSVFDMLDMLMADKTGEEVLIHCSSSNRAGAWLATWLVRERGMTVDAALAVGRTAGMTKKPLEAKVREFLANPSP